jgi:hypothetical protein
LKQALRGISDDELAAVAAESPAGDAVNEEGDLATLFEEPVFERRNADVVADAETQLPTLVTRDSLQVVDRLAQLSCGLDDEAAEFLVANRVSGLWERYTTDGRPVVDELLAGDGGRWFSEIKTRFLHEVESVEALAIPAGWSFAVNGAPAAPLPMQRRAAWAVREQRRVGNWSGVGAGKTLSAVLASRVVDARVTLIVTANAVVKGWKKQITAAYPDSVVYTQVDDGLTLDRDRHTFLVLNYEKFQTGNRDHLVHLLLGLGPDLVVFDEVQFVKQRDRHVSQRRRALERWCAARRRSIRSSGCSG